MPRVLRHQTLTSWRDVAGRARTSANGVNNPTLRLARQLVKTIKQTKLKVQVAIQGQQLRVSGKKRDILQEVIGLLKEAKVDLPGIADVLLRRLTLETLDADSPGND